MKSCSIVLWLQRILVELSGDYKRKFSGYQHHGYYSIFYNLSLVTRKSFNINAWTPRNNWSDCATITNHSKKLHTEYNIEELVNRQTLINLNLWTESDFFLRYSLIVKKPKRGNADTALLPEKKSVRVVFQLKRESAENALWVLKWSPQV